VSILSFTFHEIVIFTRIMTIAFCIVVNVEVDVFILKKNVEFDVSSSES